MDADSLGIQLHTLRALLADDLPGTLEQLAELGYRELEFAGYFDHSASDLVEVMASLGMVAPSAHVARQQLEEEPGRAIDRALEMGHRYLVLPWLPPRERETPDHYRALADFLNETGERCRNEGLALGYHNHDFEFLPLAGELPYELLLERTDPAVVCMELDVYWLHVAGGDILDTLARHPGRFELCHLKDADAGGDITEVGHGVLDFVALLPALRAAGVRHCFVEHDNPADPMASVKTSCAYLRELYSGESSRAVR